MFNRLTHLFRESPEQSEMEIPLMVSGNRIGENAKRLEFDDLDSDLKLKIWAYCEITDLRRIRSVCQSWNSLLGSKIDLTKRSIDTEVEKGLKADAQLTEWYHTFCTNVPKTLENYIDSDNKLKGVYDTEGTIGMIMDWREEGKTYEVDKSEVSENDKKKWDALLKKAKKASSTLKKYKKEKDKNRCGSMFFYGMVGALVAQIVGTVAYLVALIELGKKYVVVPDYVDSRYLAEHGFDINNRSAEYLEEMASVLKSMGEGNDYYAPFRAASILHFIVFSIVIFLLAFLGSIHFVSSYTEKLTARPHVYCCSLIWGFWGYMALLSLSVVTVMNAHDQEAFNGN